MTDLLVGSAHRYAGGSRVSGPRRTPRSWCGWTAAGHGATPTSCGSPKSSGKRPSSTMYASGSWITRPGSRWPAVSRSSREHRYPTRSWGPASCDRSQVPGMGRARDVTTRVARRDEIYADGWKASPYQGVAIEPWTFTIDLGEAPAAPVRLLLDGWIFPADASLNLAVAQRTDLATWPPRLEVETPDGWQTLMPSMGHPAGKTKTMVVDTPALPAGSPPPADRGDAVALLGPRRLVAGAGRQRAPGSCSSVPSRGRSPLPGLLGTGAHRPQRPPSVRLRPARHRQPLAPLPGPLHPLWRCPSAPARSQTTGR